MKHLCIYLTCALAVGCSGETTKDASSSKASKTKASTTKASKTKSSNTQKTSKSKPAKGQKTTKTKGLNKTTGKSARPEQEVAVSAAKVVSVRIQVEKKKANGKSWDALLGKPDIAFCVESGERIDCFPEGKKLKKLKQPKCKNASHVLLMKFQ